MATKKTTIAAEIKVDTGGAEKEVKDLKDGIEGVGEAAANSIKELKELKTKLKEAAVGSEEFKKLKQTIDDTEEAINAAKIGAGNFADIVGNLPGPIGEIGGQVSNLTGGLKQFSQVSFADIKGSFKDLFDDVKDIGANIAKTTGLTKVYEIANNAASKSLQFLGVSAKGAATASKGFALAISGLLAATGLILLTSTIQAVSEAWDYYSSRAERAEEAQKKLNDSLLKGAQVALDGESKAIKRSGDLLLAQAKARGANADEIYKIEKNNRKLLLESQERYYNELKNKDSDEARSALSAIKDTKNEILIAELNFIDQKNKTIAEKEKAAKDKKDAEDKTAKDKKDTEEKARLEKAKVDAKAYEDFDTELQQRLIALQDERDAKETARKEKAAEESKAYADFDTKLQQDLLKVEEDATAKKIALADAELQAKLGLANAIGNIAGGLSALFEKGTTAAKIAGLAEIAIGTGVGFIQGLDIAQKGAKATGPAAPFAFPIFYATQIAAVLAAASRAKSVMTQVKGGSGISMPSFGAPSIPSVSTIAPLSPSLQTTTLNQAQLNQIGNVAARAYVVESDVSGNQERIIRLNRAARIS